MATDNILRTYGDVSRKEDVVLNAVKILTATETQITNMLGETQAIDTVHIYLVDTLATAGSNAYKEGEDLTYLARTTPTRQANVVQTLTIPLKVSDIQKNVEHYHGQDELSRQTTKALKEFGNDLEWNVLRETLVSGASGTAPKMSGILQAISQAANVSAQTSGTVWSASILQGIMKAQYDAGNGEMATDLFMGSYLRNVTDDFTQKSNIVVNNPGGQTQVVRTISTFETSFGTVRMHTHRYIQESGDATGRILGLNKENLKLAWLIGSKPYVDTNLSRTGLYTPRAVVGSLTVEVHNKKAHWLHTGFKKS